MPTRRQPTTSTNLPPPAPPVLDYPAPGAGPNPTPRLYPMGGAAPPRQYPDPNTGSATQPAPGPQPSLQYSAPGAGQRSYSQPAANQRQYAAPGAYPTNPAPHIIPSRSAATPGSTNTELFADRVIQLLEVRGFTGVSRRLRSMPLQTSSLRLPGARRFWVAYLLFGMGLAALILRLLFMAAVALQDPLDTIQYGQVRTTHLSVLFGLPGETTTSPSLVTATNDHGIGHIWLLPAGQAKHATVVETPFSDIDPDGKLPIKMEVADLDRDGHPDLFITLGNTGSAYALLMDTGKMELRPPTEEERRRLTIPGQNH